MIQVIDLKRQYQVERKQLESAIAQVLSSGQYLHGPEVRKFEKEFASYLNIREAVGVGSGTDSIALALLSLGIGSGDEVIVPDNVYPSVFGILKAEATPLPCDISSQTLNLDRQSLGRVKISSKTKAILFVHLYGNPAGILEVLEFAKEKGLFLIEDCAHGHGASIINKMAGTIGDIGCFSFYPTKNLGAIGNGGMIVTQSAVLAKKIRFLKRNGEKKHFISQEIGFTTQLDEIQAAVLRVRLKLLPKYNEKRRRLAKYYRLKLSGLPIKTQQQDWGINHSYLNFVIAIKKRDQLQKYLNKLSIGTIVHYPIPLHLQPSLKYLGYKKGDFPNAERASAEILSLPMYPYLTLKEVKLICDKINGFFK